MSPHSRGMTAYLSSTFEDLQQYRLAVAQELRQAGYEPIGVEEYAAGDVRSLERRLEDVRTCDIFVGIIAQSYGDIPTTEETGDVALPSGTVRGQTSFTEYEYRQALAIHKQPLMFLLDYNVPWPQHHSDGIFGKCDNGVKIRALRENIRREQSAPFFTDEKDLAAKVGAAITRLVSKPSPATATSESNPPVRDNLPASRRLVGRQAQLTQLLQAADSTTPLICLEGNAGVGKTSLAIEAGHAYLREAADAQPRYVVWVAATTEGSKRLTLDDVLNAIARVANYTLLAQVSLAEKADKEAEIQLILTKQKFLLIVDDFDKIEQPELRQWLLSLRLPSHVLLVVRQAAALVSLPGQPITCITLDALSVEDTIGYINYRAFLAGIGELGENSALPEAVRRLAEYTKGDLRVAELAMGTLKGLLEAGHPFGEALKSVTQSEAEQSTAKIYTLQQKVWQDLAPEARKVLCSLPLFAGNALINREALLATCGLKPADFDAAQKQLLARNLLKLNYEAGAYEVDADTRGFAQEELQKAEPEFEVAARKRWSEFYRDFVERNVVRSEPDVLYWQSLVSNSMEALDTEWAAIVDVLRWADQHRKDHLFLSLTLLLMHYMDSRFLNKGRLQFANLAVQAARRLHLPYEEALLRIDALGWTYFEEDCPLKAYDEISLGLGLVKPLRAASQDAWELGQLGFAWQARVKMEIALSNRASQFEASVLREEAVHLIEKALRASCSPWVRYRIYKAAGDIAFKAGITLRQSKQDKEALDFYLQAETEVAKYGGEGASYQIAPRIGLAYLRKKDLQQAGNYFKRLRKDQNPHIPYVGELYGKYGEALINYYEHDPAATQKLEDLEKELRRHTSSNQLLKLVTTFRQTPT